MAVIPFACGECHSILADDQDQCHHCPTSPVSRDWQGLVIVFNPEMSEVGKRMGVTRPGSYALKVNIR
jgi:DNA-directed RNA polymerase subunit E"